MVDAPTRAAVSNLLSLLNLMPLCADQSWSHPASSTAVTTEKVIYLLHKQEGLRHIMAGLELAFLSDFTLYFILARLILLG